MDALGVSPGNLDIKRGRWKPEEDEVLRRSVAVFGAGNWAMIAAVRWGNTLPLENIL